MKVIIFTSFLSSILVPILTAVAHSRFPVSGGFRRTESPLQVPSRATAISPFVSKLEQDGSPNNEPAPNELSDIANPIINRQTTRVESSITSAKSATLPRSRLSSATSSTSFESSLPNSNQIISRQTNAGQNIPQNGSKLRSTLSTSSQISGSQSNPSVQVKTIRNSTTINESGSGEFSTNQTNTDFQGSDSAVNPPVLSSLSTTSVSAPVLSSLSTTSTNILSDSVDPPQVQDVAKIEQKPPTKKKVVAKSDKTPISAKKNVANAKTEKKPATKKRMVAKNKEKVPSKKQTNDTTIKAVEPIPEPAIKQSVKSETETPEPTPKTATEPPEKLKNEDEWVGPKTIEEDLPELYTVDENIRFIREFTSDMIIEGKYKIGETIMYLLEKKITELDTADKAAIDYVIKERLRKDPELIEALKKHNEKQKGGNRSSQSSNFNQGESTGIEMPPYMVQILSPSFSISQYDSSPQPKKDSNPAPISTGSVSDTNPPSLLSLQHIFKILFPPSNHNSFGFNTSLDDDDDLFPIPSSPCSCCGKIFATTSPSPFSSQRSSQSALPSSPLRSLFQFDDDEDTNPISIGRSSNVSSPSKGRIFTMNSSSSPFTSQRSSQSGFPSSRFSSVSLFGNDTNPFSGGRSNVETDTSVSSPSPSIIRRPWASPPTPTYPKSGTYHSSFRSNPSLNSTSRGYNWMK